MGLFFNNGHSSKPVNPNKGLAQGCGLSPLLFIIAMSRLLEVINRNEKIVGIACANRVKKSCLAADDMVIGTRANNQNTWELYQVLRSFYKVSGLKVNYSKSVIMRIGKWKESDQVLNILTDFVWLNPQDKTKYLGILVSAKYSKNQENHNLLLTASDIATATSGLRSQSLSLIGKILVLKSLVGSKIVYKFLHYPVPSRNELHWLNKLYYDFVWRGRHRISAEQMIQPVEKGGFNMFNVFFQYYSLQFQWLSKTLHNANEKALWEQYLRSCILIPIDDFLHCNLHINALHRLIRNYESIPPFWL